MRSLFLVVCTATLLTTWTPPAQAQPVKFVEKLVERLARQEGRVALRESEEVAQFLLRNTASTTEESLLRRLNRIQGVDSALAAEFRALSLPDRRVAIELAEGTQLLLRRYPAEGLSLLQRLDADGVAQSRTYGDFVLEGAQWLHTGEVLEALRASQLNPEEAKIVAQVARLKSSPGALAPEHVAPLWKSLVRKTGNGAGRFWRTYIQPHRGKWLAGGLLASYLAMPEQFHDAAGSLTESASRRLTELGISVVAGAVHGPVQAFRKRYADAPLRTVFATVLIVGLALLAIPPLRRLVWRGIVPWMPLRLRGATKANVGFPHHEPLRE